MTTATYRVERLGSALTMARLIELVAAVPGVTQVTVNLGRQGASTLVVQATRRVPLVRVVACLQSVGARLVGVGGAGLPDLDQTFTASAHRLHQRGAT